MSSNSSPYAAASRPRSYFRVVGHHSLFLLFHPPRVREQPYNLAMQASNKSEVTESDIMSRLRVGVGAGSMRHSLPPGQLKDMNHSSESHNGASNNGEVSATDEDMLAYNQMDQMMIKPHDRKTNFALPKKEENHLSRFMIPGFNPAAAGLDMSNSGDGGASSSGGNGNPPPVSMDIKRQRRRSANSLSFFAEFLLLPKDVQEQELDHLETTTSATSTLQQQQEAIEKAKANRQADTGTRGIRLKRKSHDVVAGGDVVVATEEAAASQQPAPPADASAAAKAETAEAAPPTEKPTAKRRVIAALQERPRPRKKAMAPWWASRRSLRWDPRHRWWQQSR